MEEKLNDEVCQGDDQGIAAGKAGGHFPTHNICCFGAQEIFV